MLEARQPKLVQSLGAGLKTKGTLKPWFHHLCEVGFNLIVCYMGDGSLAISEATLTSPWAYLEPRGASCLMLDFALTMCAVFPHKPLSLPSNYAY